MIAHWPTKTVIITPPKCGSTSLHKMLGSAGGIIVVGPAPWWPEELTQHLATVPGMFAEDWRRVLLIRKPVDRLTSLYTFWQRYRTMPPFSEWVARLEVPESINMTSRCVDFAERWDDVIRCEHLRGDVRRVLGVDVPDCCENKAERRKPIPTQTEIDRLEYLYAEDMAAVGHLVAQHTQRRTATTQIESRPTGARTDRREA